MTKSYKEMYPSVPPVELEPYFSAHMAEINVAMQEDRAEIAVQLAWRDKQIDELRVKVQTLMHVATTALGVIPVNVPSAKAVKEEIERLIAEDELNEEKGNAPT